MNSYVRIEAIIQNYSGQNVCQAIKKLCDLDCYVKIFNTVGNYL